MDKVVILLRIPIRFLIGEKDPLWAPYWSLLFPDLFYSSSNSKTWKWFCVWFDFRGFWLADIHRSGTSACPWDHWYHWPLYDKLPFASRAQNGPWISVIFGRKFWFAIKISNFQKFTFYIGFWAISNFLDFCYEFFYVDVDLAGSQSSYQRKILVERNNSKAVGFNGNQRCKKYDSNCQ